MPSRAVFEAFESRRLFTFAAFDPNFGSSGIAALATSPGGYGGELSTNYDGGSIVTLANYDLRLQRLDARGRTVQSFGKDGIFQLRYNPYGFAVDSRSGRFAVGFHDEPNNHSNEHGPDVIRFYNKNARLERTVTAADVPGLKLDSDENSGIRPIFKFDAAGRLVIALSGVVQRILPTGKSDTTFSGDGKVEIAPGALFNDLSVGGPSGSDIAVVYRTGTDFDGYYNGTDFTRNTVRLDANGSLVTTFGTNGVFKESAGYTREETSTLYYQDEYQTLAGFELLPDGSVLRLINKRISRDYNNDEKDVITLEVSKLSAKGVLGTPLEVGAAIGVSDDLESGLAVDAAGKNAYVIIGTRIIKFNAGTLVLDATFNGSDGAMNLQVNTRATSIDVDRAGRLLVVGSPLFADGHFAPTSILALTGSSGGVGGSTALYTLVANGVLDIAGTSGNDSIRLRRVAGKLEVNVNGKTRRYNFSDVSGIVIHSGAGDDVIRADITGFTNGGVVIQGGKGNDRITGSFGRDVIDGGDGDDTFYDRQTDLDVIFGGKGKNIYA